MSWGYYVFAGGEPDCENDESVACAPVGQNAATPGIWNPLPYFDTVRQDGQLGNIQSLTNFYSAAQHGHAAGGLLGQPEPEGLRAPAGAGSAPARPTSPA